MLKKIGRILLIILITAIVIIGALILTNDPDYAFFDQPGPLVIAHQGGEGLRPSNTMSAFENAVALGADVLEMDVHQTADGAHQFAGVRKLVQFLDLAASGGNKEVQSGFHAPH